MSYHPTEAMFEEVWSLSQEWFLWLCGLCPWATADTCGVQPPELPAQVSGRTA